MTHQSEKPTAPDAETIPPPGTQGATSWPPLLPTLCDQSLTSPALAFKAQPCLHSPWGTPQAPSPEPHDSHL